MKDPEDMSPEEIEALLAEETVTIPCLGSVVVLQCKVAEGVLLAVPQVDRAVIVVSPTEIRLYNGAYCEDHHALEGAQVGVVTTMVEAMAWMHVESAGDHTIH